MLRNISISPVLNGFVVQVGCQQLAYTDTNKLLGDLGDYLRNPEETEKRLIEKEGINKQHTMGSNLMPAPPQGESLCGSDMAVLAVERDRR